MRYTYNMVGGLAGLYVDGAATPLALYGYNDAGQVELITLENGTSVQMTYHATYGRLASLVNRDKTGATMTSFAYTYDLDGYVTQVEREDGDVVAYQYDGVGRLMDEWRRTSGAALVYRNRFEYDAVGNRTQWIADTPGDATTFNYTYNTLNQLTERYWTKASVNYTEDYTYDLNGNLTQKDEKTGGALQLRWLYEWDDEDRLFSVVKKNGGGTVILTVEYAYCPACGGSRTQKRVWNGTKTDENLVKWLQYETEGLNQLRVDEKWESQTDGNDYLDALDPWRTARVSYNGPGQISQMMREDVYAYASQTTGTPSNVTTIYYNYDRMGVACISAADGTMLDSFGTSAFAVFGGATEHTTRRITGKEFDTDIGLYYFHARWYQAECGRFLSRGWLRPDLEHPYVFCDNTPTFYRDPDGFWHRDVHWQETYEKCLAKGIAEIACRAIADADQGFDDNPKTRPLFVWPPKKLCDLEFHSSKHFPQSLFDPFRDALKAIEDCKPCALGAALHQIQDYWSHVFPGKIGCDWIIPWHPYDDTDDANVHLYEHQAAMKYTEYLLDEFQKRCGIMFEVMSGQG